MKQLLILISIGVAQAQTCASNSGLINCCLESGCAFSNFDCIELSNLGGNVNACPPTCSNSFTTCSAGTHSNSFSGACYQSPCTNSECCDPDPTCFEASYSCFSGLLQASSVCTDGVCTEGICCLQPDTSCSSNNYNCTTMRF